jgi:hypothetical protein
MFEHLISNHNHHRQYIIFFEEMSAEVTNFKKEVFISPACHNIKRWDIKENQKFQKIKCAYFLPKNKESRFSFFFITPSDPF